MHWRNTCLVNCHISNRLLLDSLHMLLNTGLTTLLSDGQRASFYKSLTKKINKSKTWLLPGSNTATKSTMKWASLLHHLRWSSSLRNMKSTGRSWIHLTYLNLPMPWPPHPPIPKPIPKPTHLHPLIPKPNPKPTGLHPFYLDPTPHPLDLVYCIEVLLLASADVVSLQVSSC